MRLTHLDITHFKGLDLPPLSWLSEEGKGPRPFTLVLGDNGSGKTTLLQAIALTISLATRQTESPQDLQWPGFLAERVSSRGPTRVELGVAFEAPELEATQALYKLWSARVRPELARAIAPPGAFPRVTLVYEDGALSCAEGPEAMSQFLGRFFTRYLMRTNPEVRKNWPALGGVFWFHQHRNLESMEHLRKSLVEWWSYHISPQRPGFPDFLAQVQGRLAQLFPGTRFVGTLPRQESTNSEGPDSYVLLERDGRTYDIAEMSSGEQAVLPILYDFARLSIARSVVLIDELELHLHPPEQQALLSALRKLGPDCQFIVTSHSPYLESVTPSEEEVRLEGGQRCL